MTNVTRTTGLSDARMWLPLVLLLIVAPGADAGRASGGPVQATPPAADQAAPPAQSVPLSDAEMEAFLRTARVVRQRAAPVGVTASVRATLTDGTLTHDAHIQVVDIRKDVGPATQGSEQNFRDSWTFNVAAYRLDRMIGLNLVPVSVERTYRSTPGAFTWWVDDVLMDEAARVKDNVQPPDPLAWTEAMHLIRVFDQLIYNVDRNLGNVVITKDWRVWAIDHTRAFRLHRTLRKPEDVTRCDRGVFEALKRLDAAALERETGKYLSRREREALLARRDAIVAIIEQGGETALFDRRQK